MRTVKQYIKGYIEAKPMDFISALFFFIFQYILISILYTITYVFLKLPLERQFIGFISSTIAYIITIYLLLKIYFKYNYNTKGPDVNYTRKITFHSLLMVLLLVLSYKLLSLGLLQKFIYYLASKSKAVETINESVVKENPYLLFIQITLIAPIFEEVIYRGIILNGLLKKYNPTKAILFSALFFALCHGNLPQMFNSFFSGIILGYIYVKTKSLYAAIFSHIIFNFSSSVLATLNLLEKPELLIGLGGLLLVIFIILYKKSDVYMNFTP